MKLVRNFFPIVVVMLVTTATAKATVCVSSPENSTVVLALVGGAYAAFTYFKGKFAR